LETVVLVNITLQTSPYPLNNLGDGCAFEQHKDSLSTFVFRHLLIQTSQEDGYFAAVTITHFLSSSTLLQGHHING
jgi:hypothetical protein